MHYWLINISHKKVSFTEREEEILLEFYSKSQVKLPSVGDSSIIVGKIFDEGYKMTFRYVAEINSVNELEVTDKVNDEATLSKQIPVRIIESLEGKGFIYQIQLNIYKRLEKNLTVEDLSKSLLLITDYGKPQKHFNRVIRSIKSEDFDTIRNQRVFWSRTTFTQLVNSLQISSRLDFSRNLLKLTGQNSSKGLNYIDALGFLVSYIHEEILVQGQMLIAIRDILLNSFSQLVEVDKLGLYVDYPVNSLLLIQQANRFESLYEEWFNKDVIIDIFNKIEQNYETEMKFINLFKDRPWTINLEV